MTNVTLIKVALVTGNIFLTSTASPRQRKARNPQDGLASNHEDSERALRTRLHCATLRGRSPLAH